MSRPLLWPRWESCLSRLLGVLLDSLGSDLMLGHSCHDPGHSWCREGTRQHVHHGASVRAPEVTAWGKGRECKGESPEDRGRVSKPCENTITSLSFCCG